MVPCPGCPELVAPDARACPRCGRARTQAEIDAALAEFPPPPPSGPGASLRSMGGASAGLLGLAVLAGGVWIYQRRTQAAPVAPTDAPPPAAAPAAPAAPPGPPSVPRGAWRASGAIYDLRTLAPVSNAVVTFTAAGREPVVRFTDGDGRYSADLADDADWTLAATSVKHQTGQLLDPAPPYRTRSSRVRELTIRNTSSGDLGPIPLARERAGDERRFDLLVVPKR